MLDINSSNLLLRSIICLFNSSRTETSLTFRINDVTLDISAAAVENAAVAVAMSTTLPPILSFFDNTGLDEDAKLRFPIYTGGFFKLPFIPQHFEQRTRSAIVKMLVGSQFRPKWRQNAGIHNMPFLAH